MAQTDVDQWAAAGASVLQQDRTEQIKASMGVALPGNPDQEAQLRRYAQQVGVPMESARAMPDQVKVQAQLSAFDAHGLASQFPATGQWLTNPDNARVAVDDVHQITQVEQAVRALHQPVTPTSGEPSIWDGAFWSKAGNYLIGGNPGNNNLVDDLMSASRSLAGKIGMGGALALSGITTTLDRTGLTSTLGDTTLGWAKYYDDQVQAEAAKPTEFHNKLIQSAATLGLQLPAILATGGASEAPAMGMGVMDMVALAVQHGAKGMAIPAVTDAVHTMSQVYAQTGDISQAARAAEVAYANTVAGGVVPLSAPGKLLARLLGGAAVGATQGEVSRQAMNAALPDGMQQPFDWETVALNAVTSSLMAGAMGPRAEPQRAAAVRAFNDAYEVARSDALNQQVSGLAEAAKASKLRERDPAAFKQMVADFANRGDLPPVLHIDAGKLEQILTDAGVTGDELHQTMPRVAEQLDALRTGDGPSNVPVEIPVEDFATHIAGSELEKPLLAQMRVTPEGRTVAESETFRQEQQAEMTARAEQLDASHAADTEYQASLDKMNAQVDAQLAGLKMRPDQLTANSALLRAFYQVQAERLGIAPHEFAERYPVTGSNRALDGGFDQQARGTYSPSTKTIALLKNANLSTFQHELGHFFLDTLTHMAAMPDAPAEVRADVAELFKWGGVTDLTDWHTRTVDQQRELHEKFATGWETYLMRGQAPTLELRNLFARFRAWMTAVYKNLKGAPGDFTPEVQGVFGRMIASEAAIREAELARRYMPLFDAPGKEGIPLEEWAAYQARGKDATEVAIEQLTGKSLRDMAAIDRLRTASLNSVQKDAAAKFKEIEREVRAEVMSQPVYRAWQFLTGKGEKDQQAQQDKAKASKELDPTQDSLLVAIAKLGGLDRESARKDLGVHQDNHKAESGVFGKPVFRKSGGLSADRMAEALAEHYYLPHDYSLHHLEDAIASELHGEPQYSWSHDYGGERPAQPLDPEQITHGKLRTSDLRETFGEKGDAVWRRLSDLGMTSDKVGVHPDMVADLFGFSSGDELVRTLAGADHPREVVRGLAEQRMLERHGEIASPADMARTADALVANEVRAKFIATELKALKQAVGSASDIAKAAKEVALQTIEAQRVRDIREGRYAAAGTRAARDAEKLLAKGDMAGAATAKRDQLLNLELTRAAREAKEWVKGAAEYLRKFDTAAIRKSVDPDYVDQIQTLLERFDLRAATTGKEIERRKSLGDWIKAQQEMGLEPDLPPQVLNEAFRTSYKDLKLSELKGLVDSIKQIEHLGKLKSKLLTAVDQRAYEAVRDEMSASIVEHAGDRTANTRTPTTNLGLALKGIKDFGFAHIKAATWARILDGGKEGGPVWDYLIRPANAAGDQEVTMRAAATQALHEIMAPLFKGEKMGGKGRFFPSIGRSLNRQERIAIALNTGNDGNMQRLLGGEGWTLAQIEPVLASITPEEARAVQGIWDHFETYRPMVGAMERRIYGKEPNWVEPAPIKLGGQDLRGGYYPVKYDPAASVRAEEHADAEGARRQVQGAYGAATVRRSFAKARAEEVKGRPLLYSLGGVYSGINETIHALAWSEWLIDANRLLKSTSIDRAVREHYGPEAVRQLKTWRDAVAEGEQAVNGAMDKALGKVRQSVSVAGLGFNVMSALMQPLGFTQSMVRLGTPWATKGLKHYLASPIESTAQANEMSAFMAGRTRTRFRELNELRNKVQDQGPVKDALQHGAYWLMMRMQQTVDVPTWWGGYEKAIAAGNDEARSIALADQAVIDSQGGGQTKDLSAIEMGGQAQRLFTVFYSFMNTALNLGVASKMTPTSKARMAADMLLLYTLPAVVGALFKDAVTPGDSGNYDDPEKAAKKLAAEQLGFLASLMVVVREFGEAGKMAAGLSDNARGYTGPAGVRMVGDTTSFVTQAKQGEFDDAFRKAAINLMGDTLGLPSAQMNRTITGAQALSEGKTLNPAALALGYQEPR